VSKYAANQTIRELLTRDGALEAYLADPAAFLAGRDLTEAEYDALRRHDFAALYGQGVHHYSVYQWARRIYRAEGLAAPDWEPAYFAALQPHGHPDLTT